MDLVRRITMARQTKKNLPEFRTGDTVGVYVKVKEGEKERIQLFSGVVIKTQGQGTGRTFTVRKIASGVGVERTFPFYSPAVDRVELISSGKVRRSRLYYLRGLKGRAARLDARLSAAVVAAPDSVGAADELAVTETAPTSEPAEKA
ncbi:MAG: 50S ribosomal protein L19 [Bdellovibrionales bacterium]|nr:50S ribosomal protein L19 [Bdellovibrionales bacterium]